MKEYDNEQLTHDEKQCRIATIVRDRAEKNLEGGKAMSNRPFSLIILSTLLIAALLTACSPLESTSVPNAGQMDPVALFSTLGSASKLFFARHEVGEEQLPGIVNYFIRQDPVREHDTTYPLLINPAEKGVQCISCWRRTNRPWLALSWRFLFC